MKKYYRFLLSLLVLLPGVAIAASTDIGNPLNFTPPPSDLSVVFLSDIFGMVDGVLNGSGGQMLGTMFGVFNAAVLSLGGIIILYTLLVSTMNTAHEGEMLGKKFSSIWIPIRCTLGIALLLPKASGYCVMQIFVMWVVVQGVGAADKVWEGALSYLQRGGIIIQQNIPPSESAKASGNAVIQGAGTILVGTTCMAALQQQLTYIHNSPACQKATPAQISASGLTTVCQNTIPDFINSVDVMNATPAASGAYNVYMPNFDSKDPFAALNGICGNLSWTPYTIPGGVKAALGISTNDETTMKQSRNIAVQQMYADLSAVAQSIVLNDPQIVELNNPPNPEVSGTSSTQTAPAADWATLPFGVPATPGGSTQCSNTAGSGSNSIKPGWNGQEVTGPNPLSGSSGTDYSGSCTNWISTSGSSPALLNGKELQGAVSDYNAVMEPTLNAVNNTSQVQAATRFVDEAKMNGWIMAGSYFFNLARLNQQVRSSKLDTGTGLDSSGYGSTTINDETFCGYVKDSDTSNPNTDLCKWYTASGQKLATMNQMIPYLLRGNPQVSFALKPTNFHDPKYLTSDTASSSTVFGYIGNASNMVLMGTPGQNAPTFTMKFDLSSPAKATSFPSASFHGGFLDIPGVVTTFFYNYIIRYILNMLMAIIAPMITQFFYMILSPLFLLIGPIFTTAVLEISDPSTNPILALANMGNTYINEIVTTWISIAVFGAFAAALPAGVGLGIAVASAVVMPVLASWLLIMWGVGVLCAYYIPLLPYILFTLGAFGWMIGVIEAMAAAPIVALGVVHPEGHDTFGKGEQAIMLLLNVFLRPALMIIGYMAGIILSYVGVWLMNEGFTRAMNAMQSNDYQGIASGWQSGSAGAGANDLAKVGGMASGMYTGGTSASTQGSTMWTALFSFFFLILIYTTLYIEIVQKAFDLIHILPDKVLRWLSGGQQESLGSETSGMAKSIKEPIQSAGSQMGSQMSSGIKMPKYKKPGSPGGDKASGKGDGGGGGGNVEASPDDGK